MMHLMIFKHLVDDIDSMMARDPAARSRIEVVLAYPGFQALLFYRLSRALWQRRWRLLGRIVSHLGRFFTGIEIHPGATIGRRLFIDHGIGLVVGETAEIGDDVTLYQGITLGGTAPSVNSAAQVDKKRHPTLADRVIIGSGAQILGPILVGEGARVGEALEPDAVQHQQLESGGRHGTTLATDIGRSTGRSPLPAPPCCYRAWRLCWSEVRGSSAL